MTRAAEFVKTLETDSDLMSRLNAATSSEEAKKIVSDAGFGDVHSADVEALRESDELSDSDLASASGAGDINLGGFGIGIGIHF